MKNRSTLIFILLNVIFSSCKGQTKDSTEFKEQQVLDAVKKWADNPSSHTNTFDLKILDQLKDSGQMVNNLKHGKWIEYSIDSSFLDVKTKIILEDKEIEMPGSIFLLKNVGKYLNGKKDGSWTIYKSYSQQFPLSWEREKETNYKMGLKNGSETTYQGYGKYQSPLLITHFKDGKERGEGRLYNYKSPYKIKQVYLALDDVLLMQEEYYDDGSIHHIISDTTLKNQKLRFSRSFAEDGKLLQTGFYINDTITHEVWTNYYQNGNIKSIITYSFGLEDGFYKYYHENGQLWTERTFVKGKAKDILSNFDRNGKPKEKGSLKNGNGTVILYDENGKVTGIQEYKDGNDIRP